MSYGNGRSPRRPFRKISSCAQRSASADQQSGTSPSTKSVVNSSSTPVSTKKRLSLKHKLPELSGSLTRVAKNVGSGLSSLASTFTTDQNTEPATAATTTESSGAGTNSSSSVLVQLSRENSFKM